MTVRRNRILFLIPTILFLLTVEPLACSVCFGAASAPVIDGMNFSILFMLALTYSVLGGFGLFFFQLFRGEQRAKKRGPNRE